MRGAIYRSPSIVGVASFDFFYVDTPSVLKSNKYVYRIMSIALISSSTLP